MVGWEETDDIERRDGHECENKNVTGRQLWHGKEIMAWIFVCDYIHGLSAKQHPLSVHMYPFIRPWDGSQLTLERSGKSSSAGYLAWFGLAMMTFEGAKDEEEETTEAGTKVESFLNRQTDRVNIKGWMKNNPKRRWSKNELNIDFYIEINRFVRTNRCV